LASFGLCRKQVCFRRFYRWKLQTAAFAVLNRVARRGALLLFVCILLSGCRSRQDGPGPSIEFTRVPPAAEGGPDKLDIIEGRVVGAHPGQRVVLYARSGTWWVQPLVVEPFTTIQPDSKWTNTTHLGTEYAALLVEPGYRPLATINALPTREPRTNRTAGACLRCNRSGSGLRFSITSELPVRPELSAIFVESPFPLNIR
jgi:hypothetical protein